MTTDDFIKTMVLFFPGTKTDIEGHINEYGERLDTIVIEDFIMPEVIGILKKDTDDELIKAVFGYFEDVSIYADKKLHDVFLSTALEILGNDRLILEKAKKYMGPITTALQIEADAYIGRIN